MFDTVTYTLTAREIYTALWKSRRSFPRLAVTSAILLLLGVPALVGACLGRGDSGGWLVGIALPLLAVLQWVLPAVTFRREAAALAAAAVPVTLTVGADTLAAGEVTVPFENVYIRQAGDLLLWHPDKSQLVVIPRRVLSAAAWDTLCGLV